MAPTTLEPSNCDRTYKTAEMAMTSNCSRDLDCTGEFRSHY